MASRMSRPMGRTEKVELHEASTSWVEITHNPCAWQTGATLATKSGAHGACGAHMIVNQSSETGLVGRLINLESE
jgi:hypothetical protein